MAHLLLSLDRQECSELQMTQELIANMLGVRREGVTDPQFFTDAGSLGFSSGVAAPVPEPSLALLFGTGVVSLMFLHCRRQTMLSDDAC